MQHISRLSFTRALWLMEYPHLLFGIIYGLYIIIYVWLLIKIPLSRKRPFFANKKFTFAKLSRTPCLSFAGPMLANNTSYEDSFTTCQITPENHGSLLGSLLNMQLASRNPFSGHFFLQSLLAHPLQHALWLSPALSHNFRGTFAKISLFTDPGHQQGCTEGKAKTRGLGVWLSQSLTFGNLATATRILWCPSPAGPPGTSGWQPFTYNDFANSTKNLREGFQT